MLTPATAPPVHPRRGRSRAAAALAVTVLTGAALTLSACTVSGGPSDGAAPAPQEDDPVVSAPGPSGDPSAFTPLPEVPRDSRPVGDGTFSLQAPAAFTQSTRPGPAGVEMLVLSGESSVPGAVTEVVAFSAPTDDVDLDAEVDVLLTSLREVRRARDITSSDVEWPGTESAVVVSWTQETAVAGGTLVESFVQLTVQGEDGASATAIAVAPQDEIADSGVVETLRTFRLAGA